MEGPPSGRGYARALSRRRRRFPSFRPSSRRRKRSSRQPTSLRRPSCRPRSSPRCKLSPGEPCKSGGASRPDCRPSRPRRPTQSPRKQRRRPRPFAFREQRGGPNSGWSRCHRPRLHRRLPPPPDQCFRPSPLTLSRVRPSSRRRARFSSRRPTPPTLGQPAPRRRARNRTTFQRSNVPAFQRFNVPTFQRSNVPTFQHSNVRTCQPRPPTTLRKANAPSPSFMSPSAGSRCALRRPHRQPSTPGRSRHAWASMSTCGGRPGEEADE